MTTLGRVRELTRGLLLLDIGGGRHDPGLWEHSDRVMLLTQQVAQFPEYAASDCQPLAAALAGLFSHAGWAVQVQQGELDRWQILARPTSGVQRELGAALLQQHTASLVTADVLYRATEAIRQCSDRYTELVEARVLAEAENLADMGLTYVLRQLRLYLGEGRPLEQLLAAWQRQREYNFWEARVNDTLRTDSARQVARERLARAAQFMEALAADLRCGGVPALLVE